MRVVATVVVVVGVLPLVALAVLSFPAYRDPSGIRVNVTLAIAIGTVLLGLAIVLVVMHYRTNVRVWLWLVGAGVFTLVYYAAMILYIRELVAGTWQQTALSWVLGGLIIMIFPWMYLTHPLGARLAGIVCGVIFVAPYVVMVVGWRLIGWWLIALVVAGVLALLASRRRPPLTARGSAALARVESFRRFLLTADLDQLRREAGVEVFTSYLPWAIVFDQTDRWSAFIKSAGHITSRPVNASLTEDEDLAPIQSLLPSRLLSGARTVDNGTSPAQVLIDRIGRPRQA